MGVRLCQKGELLLRIWIRQRHGGAFELSDHQAQRVSSRPAAPRFARLRSTLPRASRESPWRNTPPVQGFQAFVDHQRVRYELWLAERAGHRGNQPWCKDRRLLAEHWRRWYFEPPL